MHRYKFGKTSNRRLEGVSRELAAVCQHAIDITLVDFSVLEGLRTEKRQAELVAAGASQVAVSQHQSGRAVDLAPYIAGSVRFDLHPQLQVAEAMSTAAHKLGAKLRWGGCWRMIYRRAYSAMELDEMLEAYKAKRAKQGRRPFIDAWHFELRG